MKDEILTKEETEACQRTIQKNKKKVLVQKLEFMTRWKVKILHPIREDEEAVVSREAINFLLVRCHDDLAFMVIGEKGTGTFLKSFKKAQC